MYKDPFRMQNNYLVLCESFIWKDGRYEEDAPANTNFRHFAKPIFDAAQHEKPWFGIEQEYSLLENDTKFVKQPLGWPRGGFPMSQGPYYCSVGATYCLGRAVSDAMIKASIYAGLNISGTNSEVKPS